LSIENPSESDDEIDGDAKAQLQQTQPPVMQPADDNGHRCEVLSCYDVMSMTFSY